MITISQTELSHKLFHNLVGMCRECGNEADYPCEPDARNYKCSACGFLEVFGLEELLLMGELTVTDSE